MTSAATLNAFEASLICAVRLGDMPTGWACTRGVAGINCYNGDTCPLCFVGKKEAELKERPAMKYRALLPASPDPRTNTFEVFKGKRTVRVFGSRYYPFADRVVHAANETRFLSQQLAQAALCRQRAFPLELVAPSPMAIAHAFDCAASIDCAVTVGCNVGDTKVYTKHVVNILWRQFLHFARHQQIPHATVEKQIAFALAGSKHRTLTFAANERKRLPPVERPQRYGRTVQIERQNTIIVGDTGKRAKHALGLLVKLVGVANPGKRPHSHLCRQAELVAHVLITQLLQRELAKRAGVPRHGADVITGSVSRTQRARQGRVLFAGRLQLDLRRKLHILNCATKGNLMQLQNRAVFLRTPKGGSFLPYFPVKRMLFTGVIVFTLVGLSGCAASPNAANVPATVAAQAATPAPSPTPFSLEEPTAQVGGVIDFGISGVGEVKAARDADLVFLVQGTVAEVNVTEGQAVKTGNVLAVLDTRTFDAQVTQAEAGLASAQAQELAFAEPPKAADAAAAAAQLQQAQAQLQVVRQGAKPQERQASEAGVVGSQANLQSTRDRLSLAKTQAESQLTQAVQGLTAAQARYAQASYNWNFVQETGNDPIVPESTNPQTGKKVDNALSEGQRQNYASQFQQAEAALKQAQENVALAQANYETARQAEVTGIQAAEQQVVQAQAQLDKLNAGADAAQIAAAQAGVAQAKAAQARLKPAATNAQQAQVSAGIAQANAALELAIINRERAEMRAPFDGLVSIVNIDPGDPSSVAGGAAIRIVDVSKLHIDVQISDTDIGKISENQKIEARVDALPDTVFTGTVTYIAPTATVQGTLRSYVVRVALDQQTGLRAGMSARVDILAE